MILVGIGIALSAGSTDAAVRPRYGGTLVRGFVGELTAVDPLQATSPIEREAARQVHAGLYRFDAGGEPVPDLVAGAEVESGGTRVRLRLHEARFHDGSAVTAAAAKRSIERFAGSDTAGRLLGRGDERESLVRIISERELVLDVSRVPVLWPWLLADARAAIVPENGPKIGAGPFLVTERGDDERVALRLLAYPRHHAGRPLLDGIDYRRYRDQETLVLAHRLQGVELIEVYDSAEFSGLSAPLAEDIETVVLRQNAARLALRSPAVREEVALAIRREALVDVVLGGRADAASGFLRPRPYLAPPAVAAATAPPDRQRTALTLIYPSEAGLRIVAERLRVDLAARGFRTKPLALTSRELALALAAGDFDLAVVPLRGGGRPAVIELADAAGLMGRELPGSLRRAAAAIEPHGRRGADLLAAEAELLAGAELTVLFRRNRRLFLSDSIHDAYGDIAASAMLERAWRWREP